MLSDHSKSIVGRRNGTDDCVPIRAQSRDSAVLEALAHFVASSGILPGDRLPIERRLSERLRVGRSTVREALKRWQGLGVIERRQGSGTYLCRAIGPDAVHLSLTMIARDFANLTHLLEIRRALEVEAAGICAGRAGSAQIVDIAAKLEAAEKAIDRHDRQSAEADWAFIYRYSEQLKIRCLNRLSAVFTKPCIGCGSIRSEYRILASLPSYHV
jgi:GntR family transcriptional regulator, transcriptional repressor for pyruvate dehydrogenase complex